MNDLPLLSSYKIKLLTYDKIRARKLIAFARPCIGYLLHGTAEFWLNGQSYTANEGDLIYIAAETEYYSVWTGDPQVQWYSVDFSFSDPLAFSDFRFQILKNYPVWRLNEMYTHFEQDQLASLSAFYALQTDQAEIIFSYLDISLVNFAVNGQGQRHGVFGDGLGRIAGYAQNGHAKFFGGGGIQLIEAGATQQNRLDARLVQPSQHGSAEIGINKGANGIVAVSQTGGFESQIRVEIIQGDIGKVRQMSVEALPVVGLGIVK